MIIHHNIETSRYYKQTDKTPATQVQEKAVAASQSQTHTYTFHFTHFFIQILTFTLKLFILLGTILQTNIILKNNFEMQLELKTSTTNYEQ